MDQSLIKEHVVRIHVDRHPYESPTPTTGAALYLLAHVPAGFMLFKEGHEQGEDTSIGDDSASIELKHGEHFRIGKPEPAATTIYVNTEAVSWHHPRISYDELVKLAFPEGPFDGNVRYSITWSKPDGSEGALLKGGHIKVVDGMKFDVRNTDKS